MPRLFKKFSLALLAILLLWPAAEFAVECQAPRPSRGDLLVRFPSPLDTGNPVNDRVAVEWYAARDDDSRPIRSRRAGRSVRSWTDCAPRFISTIRA